MTLHLIFGPQGAGKSTHAHALAKSLGGLRFSIDEWMYELYGPDLPNPIRLDWIMERVGRVERQIWAIASQAAHNGGVAILDLGFTKVASRDAVRARAEAEGFAVEMHYVTAPHALRRQRVLARNEEKGATFSFEVTPTMFDVMEREFEPATQEEREISRLLESS
ncbi:AAA family ATPase [Halopseudomonas salegens]|uniref:Predicted kinase n=1 Tax=Halopseudomonas salegens TaxID=1434072 RepID=A0A1H2FAU6_9GAMM|nr:ATP-binding protein [Halopseudomonas salegens]SDU04088.1 Predicted kinase [Halopseudomonas salegens]